MEEAGHPQLDASQLPKAPQSLATRLLAKGRGALRFAIGMAALGVLNGGCKSDVDLEGTQVQNLDDRGDSLLCDPFWAEASGLGANPSGVVQSAGNINALDMPKEGQAYGEGCRNQNLVAVSRNDMKVTTQYSPGEKPPVVFVYLYDGIEKTPSGVQDSVLVQVDKWKLAGCRWETLEDADGEEILHRVEPEQDQDPNGDTFIFSKNKVDRRGDLVPPVQVAIVVTDAAATQGKEQEDDNRCKE